MTSPARPRMTHVQNPSVREERPKGVNDVLRRVDQLVKKGALEEAQVQIEHAKTLDPRNMYTLALEERIAFLLSAANGRDTTVTADADEAMRSIVSKENSKSTTAVAASASSNGNPVRPSAPVIPLKPNTPTPPPPSGSAATTPEMHQAVTTTIPKPSKEKRDLLLAQYRSLLAKMWSDTGATPEDRERLKDLICSPELSSTDFESVEREAKYECYWEAVHAAWAAGLPSAQQTEKLTQLRTTLRITEREHDQIVQKAKGNMTQNEVRPVVLVVDDDTALLNVVAETIREEGFAVQTVTSSDEALALLREWTPDLILSDINLETSSMGGFSFYEKVQGLERAQKVPFIFLTGLTDEVMMRAGRALGVDDYLLKPISGQTLMATIKGKIKRFEKLRNSEERAA